MMVRNTIFGLLLLFIFTIGGNVANEKDQNDATGEITLAHNKLIANIPNFGKTFEISFDVFPTKFSTAWSDVLHITVSAGSKEYDQLPGIWFRPTSDNNANTNKLHICSKTSGCIDSNPLPLNQWIKVKFVQEKNGDNYLYSVYLNDNEVFKKMVNETKEYKDVNVYSSDPWYHTQEGKLRNLIIKSDGAVVPITVEGIIVTTPKPVTGPKVTRTEFFMNTKTKIIKDKVIKTLPVLNKNFEVSFDVLPTSYDGGWKNVLHMTQGGNIDQYGDRIPGIWFHPGTSGALHICFAISGNRNWCYNSRSNDLNKWLNIRITQGGQLDLTGNGIDKMIYSIYLNNVQVYTTENRQPQDFTDVKVYVGDKWYDPLKGHIKNLVIKNIGELVTTIGTSVPSKD